MNDLTVVVPFWNGNKTIGKLIDSIPSSVPIIIVDDLSDEKPKLNVGPRNIRVLQLKEKGYFTGAVNFGIEQCHTDVVVLNQDISFISDQWLDFIEQYKSQYATIGEKIAGNHPAWPQGYIHGTFMFIRRDAWIDVGPMNAHLYPLWGSTCEWQLRACRKGYQAFPVDQVPGMVHEWTLNKKPYGSAITEILRRQPERRGMFIKTPPEISVVVNCYNHGKYLEDLINSLIGGPTSIGHMQGQSFQSFEIIIVNDGSTDDTGEICNELANPWKGIRCIHQKNMGSAVASNTGINLARGKYIAMLDADDMMLSHRLEDLYNAQLQNPHSVVYDDLLTFDFNGITKNPHGEPKVWKMPTYDFQTVMYKNNMHKGIMFPKVAWEDVGGYPEIMNKGREDWAFNVGLGRLGWCGIKVSKPGYLYRRQGQNRTLHNTTPKWREYFQRQLESLYPDIYKGEFPMGCCGGNKTGSNNRSSQKSGGNKMTLPGRSGMVRLQYIGKNAGDSTFWGTATQTRYVFGSIRKQGYVDIADADELLNMYKHGIKLFELVQDQPVGAVEYIPENKEPEYPKETSEPKHSEELVGFEELSDLDEPVDLEEVVEEESIDPAGMTVAELKNHVDEFSREELESLLELEKSGRNRASALAVLEEALRLYD